MQKACNCFFEHLQSGRVIRDEEKILGWVVGSKEAPLLMSSGAVFWCPLRTSEQKRHQNPRPPRKQTQTLARELLYFPFFL